MPIALKMPFHNDDANEEDSEQTESNVGYGLHVVTEEASEYKELQTSLSKTLEENITLRQSINSRNAAAHGESGLYQLLNEKE
eukprot:5610725-Ditylum_brightwellii.AAC.1